VREFTQINTSELRLEDISTASIWLLEGGLIVNQFKESILVRYGNSPHTVVNFAGENLPTENIFLTLEFE